MAGVTLSTGTCCLAKLNFHKMVSWKFGVGPILVRAYKVGALISINYIRATDLT